MRRFDLEGFLKTAERFQVTEVSTVPPMALAIVKSPLSKHPYLKSARRGSVGAAPLDKDVQAQFRSLFAEGASYNQVWGMTETSCIATMFYYPENDDTGSVGRPIPCLEMKYVD
jgi:acyl-CoA synthetase (AMP-forming)/AMP-acid ligase II